MTGGDLEGDARMQEEAFRRLREQPILLGLFNYWNHKRAGKDVADRRDIDPTDMPPALLPHLALVEIFDDNRLKLRLAGTELVRQHGRDNTGKYVDEYLRADYLAYITTLYTELRDGRQPIIAESAFLEMAEGAAAPAPKAKAKPKAKPKAKAKAKAKKKK